MSKYLSMDCPKCGSTEFAVQTDEVDIGVGIQVRIRGGECPKCGAVEMCSSCGVWETVKGIEHYPWCDDNENLCRTCET